MAVDDIKQDETYQAGYRYATYLLSGRDYSASDLSRKLQNKMLSDVMIATLLDELQAQGYQSDARFAGAYVRGKAGAGQGESRIRQGLRQKGVGADLIEQVLAEQDIDWFTLALETYQRKYGERPFADYKEKQKRIRFMLYRGFAYEQIQYALSGGDS